MSIKGMSFLAVGLSTLSSTCVQYSSTSRATLCLEIAATSADVSFGLLEVAEEVDSPSLLADFRAAVVT